MKPVEYGNRWIENTRWFIFREEIYDVEREDSKEYTCGRGKPYL